MSYQPFTIDKFAGLNLTDNVSEIGLEGAIDISNVMLDYPGRVRSRNGTTQLVAGTSRDFGSLHVDSDGNVFAVDDTNDLMRVYNSSGAAVTTSGHPDSTGAWYAETNNAVYYSGQASQQIKKFSAGSVTSPAGLASIAGDYLAVQPVDDRLVVANEGGVDGVLAFSNAGDPETFTADDTIEFDDTITGLVAWDNLLFAFQRNRFHVFYGNSTDATGGSIFNYRTVDVGVGCFGTASGTRFALAGRDGVYFVWRDGVYRTRGDKPERISDAIAPLWERSGLAVPDTYGGSMSQIAGLPSGDIAWARDTLYLNHSAETYVLYKGQWTVYDLTMASMAGIPTGIDGVVVYTASGSGNPISYLTNDPATGVASRYQSGFYDLGSPNEKRIRETLLDGQGTVNLDVRSDYATSGTDVSVALGTAPATGSGRSRSARRGRLFSHKVSASSGAWVLDRMTHHIADQRGVR